MRRLGIFLVVLTLIGGCATAKQIYTSDGQQGYNITCSGSALNWGMCYEKAGKICGEQGYEIIEKNEGQGAMVSGTQYGVFGGSVVNRNMIIKCKL